MLAHEGKDVSELRVTLRQIAVKLHGLRA